jgi:hypothetical protein
MITHELKCWPVYFQSLQSGQKTFEFRFDDRCFKVGDRLVIKEWDEGAKQFTGCELFYTVTYIMRSGSNFPLPDGWVIMGLGPIKPQFGVPA